MPYIIPDTYNFPLSGVEWQTRSPIRALEWRDLSEHQHLMWQRRAERITGLAVDPIWNERVGEFTTAPVQALYNLSSVPDLTEWKAQLSPTRQRPSDDQYLFECRAYGNLCTVRFTIDQVGGSTTITEDVELGSWEWGSAQFVIADDSDTWEVTLEAKTDGGNPSEGFLQVDIFGAFLTPSDLDA